MNLQIRTRDNLTYDISDIAGEKIDFRRGETNLNLDLVEKSFRNGAILIGERRIESKELDIGIELFDDDDTNFRQEFNQFCYYASQAEYIEDTDNSIRTKVEFLGFGDNPYQSQGTVNRGGYCDLKFRQLTPFWEDTTVQTDTDTGTDLTFNINNSGYLDTSATFTITASALCESILIYISDPVRGIEIQDLSFGYDSTLDEYVINNEDGTALLGDEGYNRNDRIRGGSGFFDFPVGNFTLNAEFPVSCQMDISWRRRYFV
jgi:hypothetical protein